MGAHAASAKDYWVAVTGNDRSPGTVERPFANPQQALDLAQSGDRVVVRPGVYHGRFVVPRSGTADKPIVFEGEPGAILDGGDRLASWEPAGDVGRACTARRPFRAKRRWSVGTTA